MTQVRRSIRAEEAQKRQAEWAKLTPQQQLKALDERPGESKRQRARLEALIESSKRPQPKAKVAREETPLGDDGERLRAKDRRALEQGQRPGSSSRS